MPRVTPGPVEVVRLRLHQAIIDERRARGFTTGPTRVFTLLVEEVGEVARELERTWSPNYDEFAVDRLAPELADILALLAARYDIDLVPVLRRAVTSRGRCGSCM